LFGAGRNPCPLTRGFGLKKNIAIALDLDGVIANIDDGIKRYFENNNLKAEYKSWLVTDTKNELAMSVFNDPLFWVNLKPYEDAWYKVNEWFNNGIDIHIVTARRCFAAVEDTIPWLEKWNIGYSKVHFSKFGEKINIIQNIDPVFMIEDNPHEINVLKNHNIKCFMRNHWYNFDHAYLMDTINTFHDIDLESL
jgi:hypothetical protein